MAAQHCVYRMFDTYGRLLYVGLTGYYSTRMSLHRAQVWWSEVSRIDRTDYPDRLTAEAAERDAILTEGPWFNVHIPKDPTDPHSRARQTRSRARRLPVRVS